MKSAEKKEIPNQGVKLDKGQKAEVPHSVSAKFSSIDLQDMFRKIPYRVFIEGLMLVVLILVALKLPAPKQPDISILKKLPPITDEANPTPAGANLSMQSGPAVAALDTNASTPIIISSAWLTPAQPTIDDPIHLTVKVSDADPEKLTYSYQWKVNDKTIPQATGETLNGNFLKKGDRVSAVVTPFRNQLQGPPFETPYVVVHSRPITLEMKIPAPPMTQGRPIEIQMIAKHPEGDRITYSLAEPYIEGMKIEEKTGIITWTSHKVVGGTVRFGVGVKDEDGNRMERIFELQVGLAPGK